MTVKDVARRLLGDRRLGVIDYYRFPARRLGWGGPFNGQQGRRAMYESILSIIRPALILETGTFLGTTTELFAQTGLPVVTIEAIERNYGFSRTRLRRYRNVDLRLGDSRQEARRALLALGIPFGTTPIFAYLDAHWNDDLPLAEELDIVFGRDPDAVVMVDDFRVPDDPGYEYDDYGPGKVLNRHYIESVLVSYHLLALYPVLPSTEETGARRGCVILVREGGWAAPLLAGGTLRLA